jgi:two-component system chemotaxis sensor kinase CheA
MSEADATETFRQEAQELLEVLEQALLDLEHTPTDTDLVDTAFRALHTIKGSGAMFGFDAVAAFTHHVETAFDLVRKGKVTASRDLIAVTLTAKDHMRLLIERPETADAEEGAAILQALSVIVEGSPASPSAEPGAATWRIQFRLARDAMAMGTNPLLLLDDLRSLGTATVTAQSDTVPPLEELVPTDCYLGWGVVLSTAQPRAAIEDVFMFVIDDMDLKITQIGAADEPIAPAPAQPETEAPAPQPVEAKPPPATAEQPQPVRAAKTADSIRVPAERLDDLMDRVGELMIAQSRLSQVAANSNDAEVKEVAEEIERLAVELRDTTMGVRTMPIGSLFGRFRRLVHDLAQQLDKQIVLTTNGEETELDKTMIERLNDPLIHLIRNSIDHGLEAPEARIAAGKSPHGHITLSARHAGTEVLVSIVDDGRGLDRARIQARAEEQGLLPAGAKPSDSELFQVLFQPGFSTAREVTSLSGRGVGMDVVKRAIEGLRGKIDVTSTSGKGTVMTLRLPLTLAIIDGLLVRVGAGRYVLPLSAVEECVELSTAEDARQHGRSFLNIRGDLVPYLRLRELFRTSTPPDPYQKVVIVSAGGQRVGLVVDQVIGNHQTVIKSLSKLHADSETFSGATILGDGAVALILDVAHLVDFGQAHEDRLKATG